MRKGILIAIGTLVIFGSGCASMEKAGAYLKQMNEEANARAAENARLAKIEANLASNLPDTLSGVSVQQAAVAVEKIQTAKGYSCHDVAVRDGATGDGIRVDCDKRTQTDLGSAVTMNVLGNMLGADRGKIIRESIDENSTDIRMNWASDGASSSGKVGFSHHGLRYKINQNDQHVEEAAYNMSDKAAFNDQLQSAPK